MCELWVTSGCVERPAPAYITLYTLWLSSDFYDMIYQNVQTTVPRVATQAHRSSRGSRLPRRHAPSTARSCRRSRSLSRRSLSLN